MTARRVAFGLLWLTVFSIPWQNMVIVPGVGTISRTIGIAAALAAAVAVLRSGRMRPLHPLHALIWLFATWNFMSFFWSVDPPPNSRVPGSGARRGGGLE